MVASHTILTLGAQKPYQDKRRAVDFGCHGRLMDLTNKVSDLAQPVSFLMRVCKGEFPSRPGTVGTYTLFGYSPSGIKNV